MMFVFAGTIGDRSVAGQACSHHSVVVTTNAPHLFQKHTKVSKTVPEVDQILKRIGDLSLAGYRAIKSGALAWVDHVVVVGMRQTRGDDEVEVLAVKLYKE